jgi:hypothetical protein
VNANLSDTFRAYAQGLPVEDVSRCPVCSTLFKLPIDPYGLDGPWWWSGCPTELPLPESCRHFQLLQGAVDLHDRNPTEAGENVQLGPAIPFVVPRILAMDGMSAVISSRQLPAGDTIYLITYFSANPRPNPDLYQSWRRETMAVHDDQGHVIGWTINDDPWDFDLRKWVASGKLWWIAPGETSLTLQHSSPSPYDGLPGTRDMQTVEAGGMRVIPGPKGTGANPFE